MAKVGILTEKPSAARNFAAALSSYEAGWRACDRRDIATERTRRQLNEMWIPSPCRPITCNEHSTSGGGQE